MVFVQHFSRIEGFNTDDVVIRYKVICDLMYEVRTLVLNMLAELGNLDTGFVVVPAAGGVSPESALQFFELFIRLMAVAWILDFLAI